MGKILVLAEKPSVGQEIARVLGCRKSGGGYLEGDKYIVTWALGHLVTLSEPETYGEQYKKWSMETLPILPEKMELKVIPNTSKQYSVVRKLLNDVNTDSVIIATDAGREGELVARWIIDKANCRKPLKRLWISSQTDRAIKQGFDNLKDGKDYYNLYMSAQARAEADWIVGFNITRALTCKHNAQLSGGRVQTPTLAIIVRREKEIRSFRPKYYYTVKAELGGFYATFQHDKGNSQIFDKDFAEELKSKLQDASFKVTDVKRTNKRTPPPALYDLTELQRDANKIYGMSAKETLSVIQRLYEQHKALTYPRTDSRYLTDDIVPTLDERLAAVSMGEFAPVVSRIRSERRRISTSCVNNAKVSDHHAIIPTEEQADVLRMSNEEKRIYLLVVKRFLSNFFDDYEYITIRATLSSLGYTFTSNGRTVINLGWRDMENIADEEEQDEQYLPEFRQG
ncbi:MAG: DNA topoisomerase III, partial [Clostridiales bacterium]|nr:DNA topoisomerase III [Clostridiales bacterium]